MVRGFEDLVLFKVKPFFPSEIASAWHIFSVNVREHAIENGLEDRFANLLMGLDRFCNEIDNDYDKRGRVKDYFYGYWRVITDDMGINPDSPLMDPFYVVTQWFENR